MKLCKDCRYYKPSMPECSAPNGSKGVDYVHGTKLDPVYWSAQAMRQDKRQCGPDAAWYEEKA